jgi:hypothetical protein
MKASTGLERIPMIARWLRKNRIPEENWLRAIDLMLEIDALDHQAERIAKAREERIAQISALCTKN